MQCSRKIGCMQSYQFSSVQFSLSVMCDSLWPHGLLHARPPWPSPTPGAYSNSHPSRWWCHPNISSSVVSFSFCLQSFLASGSFPMSQFFASRGQSIGVSASASVLPMNVQDWFTLGLTHSSRLILSLSYFFLVFLKFLIFLLPLWPTYSLLHIEFCICVIIFSFPVALLLL